MLPIAGRCGPLPRDTSPFCCRSICAHRNGQMDGRIDQPGDASRLGPGSD